MDLATIATFVAGVALLVSGAELTVRGAARLAARTGVAPVVIGLTVVACGTSAPELAVSVQAAFADEANLAIGNVVGSNIANILLVLGLSALAGTIYVAQRIVRIDVPLVIGASVLIFLVGLNGTIGRAEGLLLVAILVGYTIWTVRAARCEPASVQEEYDEALDLEQVKETPVVVDLVYVVVGIAMLVLGGRWLVVAASTLAAELGVSDLVIGLTVVAVGTSAPEIATSVIAAFRGERDMAVGNAIGSNLWNLLGVLGASAVVAPAGLPISQRALNFDIPVMVAVSIAVLPIFFHGYAIKRWEGALFLAYYGAYISYTVLRSTEHSATDEFATAFAFFVLPLTAITLVVIGWRAWRDQRVPTG